MDEFISITSLARSIKVKFDSGDVKKKITLLYAFNSTGKTRLSSEFTYLSENNVLCYNAFIEDLFIWDNENYVLKIDKNSKIVKIINEEGLENQIIENYISFVKSQNEPQFRLDKGEISFKITSGHNIGTENIKISKGEESIFMWSVFYTILTLAIDELSLEVEDRSTNEFNDIKYIIIDDPVSSLDDSKIVTMAMSLIKVINSLQNKKLCFLITTHHALFFNIIYNSYPRRTSNYIPKHFILKRAENTFYLDEQRRDSPFGYHLLIKKEIENAITNDDIKKYHFNLFRTILEKTAIFLGYYQWGECLTGSNREEFIRLINLFSHDKFTDLEYNDISDDKKELFKESYNEFIATFKWNVNQQ